MTSTAIKQRLLASLLPSRAPEAVLHDAGQLAARLTPEGAWPDLPHGGGLSENLPDGPEHLRRTLLLAQAQGMADGALDDPLRRALDFWLAHDFQAPTWQQNQLAIPRLVGSAALLFDEKLSPGARGKVMEILARSRWQQWVPSAGWTDRTGTSLLRMAYNVILRGCVCDLPAVFEEAFARVFGAVRLAADGEEGIGPDMIYRTGPAEPSSGYEGLAFATECARFAGLAHGTPWQASTQTLGMLAAFLLDGQQWLMRNGMVDTPSADQGMARDTADLEGLAAAVSDLAQHVDTPRRAELADLGRRLLGQGEMLVGHRHFWRAGFSVHQRPAYYASVHLFEPCAGQDGRTPTVPVGMTRVMRSGSEYEGVASTTPGDGASGTTFQRGATQGGDAVAPLAGGISDGEYGLAALRIEQPGLNATKSWYYFDHSFVCLGAGISASGPNQTVFTSVNHCRLNAPVLAAADLAQARPLPPGGEHPMPRARRVSHDGITYHFVQPSRVVVQTGAQRGSGLDAPERFALWLNHGLNPQDESYAYIVLPLGDDTAAKTRADEEVGQIEILANTPAVQAVRHRGLKLVGVTFWKAGMVTVPGGGRVAANQPCVLLCRDAAAAGKRLCIVNLRREATTVHVEYAGRSLGFELPGGPDAGRGVSRSM